MFKMFRFNVLNLQFWRLIQSRNLLKHLITLLLRQIPFALLIQFIELLNQKVIPLIHKRVNLLLKPILVIRVKNCQEEVHQEEKAEDQKADEEEAVGPVDLVGGEHEVGEVGGGHQHEEAEGAVAERGEVLDALRRAAEEAVADPAEEEDVGGDEKHHLRGV